MARVEGRLVIIREGHGESQSIENLVHRTGKELGVIPSSFWSMPAAPRYVISSPERAVRAAEIAATLRPAACLLTADFEDGCPSKDAPAFAEAVGAAGLPFPVAVVLFYREFETLAISVASQLGGRELRSPAGQAILTLQAPKEVPVDPEAPRDAKGWVSKHLMGGASYKPTIHQYPLTKVMGVTELQVADLSSFRRLQSAMHFLADEVANGRAGVYPPAVSPDDSGGKSLG